LASGRKKYAQVVIRIVQDLKKRYVPSPMFEIMQGVERAITNWKTHCIAEEKVQHIVQIGRTKMEIMAMAT